MLDKKTKEQLAETVAEVSDTVVCRILTGTIVTDEGKKVAGDEIALSHEDAERFAAIGLVSLPEAIVIEAPPAIVTDGNKMVSQ